MKKLNEVNMIDLNKMTDIIKGHPDFHKAGMIASHLGIVRSFSRNGKAISGLYVEFEKGKVEEIIRDIKSQPGIVDILVETSPGSHKVGDDILVVMVAGDIRENVFSALIDAVNRLKKEASTKKEELLVEENISQ
jgi:molybdopterin synthase catalytic subunit